MTGQQYKALSLVVAIGLLASFSSAEDLSGRVGLTGLAQAGIPLGVESVRKQGNVGTDLGGMLSYGLTKHWGIGASYENIDLQHGLRVEPIALSGIYSFTPDSAWNPYVRFGTGLASTNGSQTFNNAIGKAALGLQYFFTHQIAVGPEVNYTYVSKSGDAPKQVHALGVGLTASYYFTCETAPAVAAAAPAPVPPPAAKPVVAAVGITLIPAESTLGPGQSQQINPTISGTSNQGVTWSYAPQLGTLSSTGLYTAPATVALPEIVTISATSTADPTKSATSLVKLTPPAAAPQKVSIELKVLFDTGKDVVKSQFDGEFRQVADFMKSYPSAHAEIEGHTDSTGSVALNTALSERRAQSVRQYLVDKYGIEASRLTAKGYGPTQPIADNKTAEGRAKNRRVVATLSAVKS